MLKLATVFSGIGAVEQALKKQKIKYDIKFACDNGEIEIKDDYDGIYGMMWLGMTIKNYLIIE